MTSSVTTMQLALAESIVCKCLRIGAVIEVVDDGHSIRLPSGNLREKIEKLEVSPQILELAYDTVNEVP